MLDSVTILEFCLGILLGIGIVAVISRVRQRQRLLGLVGRPLGLSCVALFQSCLGTLLLVGLVFAVIAAANRHDEIAENLQKFALTPAELIAGLATVGLLALAAGIGLWRGTTWGWRIATFSIACALVRNILAMCLDHEAIEKLGGTTTGFYAQHFFRGLIAAAMLAYLYLPHVLGYCQVFLTRAQHVKSLFLSVMFAFALEFLQRYLLH